MDKKFNSIGLPIGGPTLLMIFVILCINIFAVISYMSALRDYNLSEKAAENITMYYKADSKAETILSNILTEYKKNPDSIYKFKGADDFAVKDNKSNISFEYSVFIKKDMVLKVVAEVSKTTKEYDIIMWKKINTSVLDDSNQFLDLPEF